MFAWVARLVEQFFENPRVGGSISPLGTMLLTSVIDHLCILCRIRRRAPVRGLGAWFVRGDVMPPNEALIFVLEGVSPSDEPQYPRWKRGRL